MTALLLSAALLLACDSGDPPPAASPQAGATVEAEAPSPSPPAPAAGASTAEVSGAAAAILGEWTIVMTDEDRRQLEVLRLAFKDPPATDAEIAAATLSNEEKMMVGLMAAAKASRPDDPKVVEMQQALSGLENATLVITPQTMTLKAGEMSKDAPYTVKSHTDSQVTVETVDAQGAPETTTIILEGPDTLVLKDMSNAKRTQRFQRKVSPPADGR